MPPVIRGGTFVAAAGAATARLHVHQFVALPRDPGGEFTVDPVAEEGEEGREEERARARNRGGGDERARATMDVIVDDAAEPRARDQQRNTPQHHHQPRPPRRQSAPAGRARWGVLEEKERTARLEKRRREN